MTNIFAIVAVKFLPDSNKKSEYIFNLSNSSVICKNLKKWAKTAGITKHINFHKSRHTFATLLLNYWGDIYSVSKLFGHKKISTTEIYAKIIDEKKREAVNLIPEL
jgi:site-specific recombinase XerD